MKKYTYTSLCVLALLPGLALAAGQTTRVSVDSAGGQAIGWSEYPSISADGRYVAFSSQANNLVVGDNNTATDVFVRDRQTGQTERVSVASDGGEGNDSSFLPSISADGRYVAFSSLANNLVAGDSNGQQDVFVHDRQTGQTLIVSVDSAGVTTGNNDSYSASISADGRYVAFWSSASNLVAGDTNGMPDIFVRERLSGKTVRVSVASNGGQANWDSYYPGISADGRYVTFMSNADNLVVGDTNGWYDVFVHDRRNGKTTRVNVNSTGGQSSGGTNPAISADGRYVTFSSDANNLVTGDTNGYYDVFVHDRQNGKTTRVSVDSAGVEGNQGGYDSSISADGRYVVFGSQSDNLVAGDTNGIQDVYIHDRQSGKTSRVSVDSKGVQGNKFSGEQGLSISGDGRYVAFNSQADNLVIVDSNGVADVFVRDRLLQPQTQADVSLALSGPANVIKGSDATYTFTVSNNGSINVANATLTGIISTRGNLKSIAAGQGTCRRAAVPVCRLGTLTPGQSVNVTATVTINGTTIIKATGQAAPKDGEPGNNSKSITTKLQ